MMRPADERRHEPGPELRWAESWSFDFVSDDGALGGWARLTLLPHASTAWYHAFLAGPDRQLVAVLDHEVPVPADDLEIRTTGLWATHICETAFDHWTIGLEAFGLGVDDVREMYGRQFGDRVPLGFDLEWESVDRTAHPAVDGYQQPCVVSGEILVGDDEVDFLGTGWRDHRWGVLETWDRRWLDVRGRLDDGVWFSAHVVGGDLSSAIGFLDGSAIAVTEAGQTTHEPGVLARARVRLGGLDFGLEAVAVTPVEVVDVERRAARSPRALCRVTSGDGRTGNAWVEWNEPRA
ncbi:DUF7064 domain-containing protein [Actinospongicola halichondriae]|uniref:DUF7064 domain-containing protein n=1 Tax=Actinospongicola halichondriae TaxID=3236844 RepID=UPI003D54E7C1